MAIIAVTGYAIAANEHIVIQKDKHFSVKILTVKVGDWVSFKNDDAFFHNVFSLSDAQSFDLGSHGQGQARRVQMAKEGTVDIECAIHPEMKMQIKVMK